MAIIYNEKSKSMVPIVGIVLKEFEQTYHLLYFPDVSSLVEPVARIEEIQSLVCIVLMREATPIPD